MAHESSQATFFTVPSGYGPWLILATALLPVSCTLAEVELDSERGGGDCREESELDALYPLQEGAWWHHSYQRGPDWVLEDKVNYVCEKQAMPRMEGKAFPLVSLKVGASYAIRWQGLQPCQAGDGFDIRRYYDESYDLDGARTKIRYYCPFRQRTIDCQVSTEEFPWFESYRDASIEAPEADWSECEQIQIDPETCEPTSEVPEGCSVLVCPDDEECHDDNTYPDEAFQLWEEPVTVEELTVEAGTFSEVTAVTNVDWQGETATFWWGRRVGKIKEESVGFEIEELVDYCIPAGPYPAPPPFEPTMVTWCPEP